MKKRFLSAFLALYMALEILPGTAGAMADNAGQTDTRPRSTTITISGQVIGKPEQGTHLIELEFREPEESQEEEPSGDRAIETPDIPNAPEKPEFSEPSIKLTDVTLPDGIKSAYYTWSPGKTCGESDGLYSLTGGKLPDGLSLNAETGEIFGAPTCSGTWNFVIQQGNWREGGEIVNLICELTIQDKTALEPADTNVTLPDGVKYIPYYWSPENADAVSGVSYVLASGTLPSGLYLNGKTGEISGVPMAASTWDFVIQQRRAGKDSETVSQNYTITIQDNTDDVIRQIGNDYPITTYIGTPSETDPGRFVLDSYRDESMVIEGPYRDFIRLLIDGRELALGEDYESREGSTVNTIYGQTFQEYGPGNHTIAAEFQGSGGANGKRKMVSQNYYVPVNAKNTQNTAASKPKPASKPAGWPFEDVSTANWYYDDVKWSYDGKMMTGVTDTRFAPMTSISQATIVTVLSRMASIDLTQLSGVTDSTVASGKWYTEAAIWAKQSGLLPDYNVFTGDEAISRDQMAIMLSKYLQSMGKDAKPPAQPVTFADAGEMSQAGNDAFQVLYAYNIFRGVGGGRMDPAGSTTRAQFAALVHRISDTVK